MQRMSGMCWLDVRKQNMDFFIPSTPSYKRENSEKMLLITSYMHVPRGIVGQL